MPKSIESLKELYHKRHAIYLSAPSDLSRDIHDAVANALDAALRAQQQLESVDYYYNHYLYLTKDHP